jgi:hypothetical protein
LGCGGLVVVLGGNGAAHTGHQSPRGDEINIFKGKKTDFVLQKILKYSKKESNSEKTRDLLK